MPMMTVSRSQVLCLKVFTIAGCATLTRRRAARPGAQGVDTRRPGVNDGTVALPGPGLAPAARAISRPCARITCGIRSPSDPPAGRIADVNNSAAPASRPGTARRQRSRPAGPGRPGPAVGPGLEVPPAAAAVVRLPAVPDAAHPGPLLRGPRQDDRLRARQFRPGAAARLGPI